MTARHPWSKFFWSDWESDQKLRLCSLAAQGLWMRMLCYCAGNDPKGQLSLNGKPLDVTHIARLAGVTETEAATLMNELDRNGVFSRNRTGCIYSRRMVRDEKLSQEGRKHKKRGILEANENKGENVEPSRGPLRHPSPHIPYARVQKEKRDTDVSQKPPDLFDEFWSAYPQKVGKVAARRNFDRAVKAGADPGDIIAGAKRYAASENVRRGYVKHPQGWLTDGRWADEAQPPIPQPSEATNDRQSFLRKIAGASS